MVLESSLSSTWMYIGISWGTFKIQRPRLYPTLVRSRPTVIGPRNTWLYKTLTQTVSLSVTCRLLFDTVIHTVTSPRVSSTMLLQERGLRRPENLIILPQSLKKLTLIGCLIKNGLSLHKLQDIVRKKNPMTLWSFLFLQYVNFLF